MITHHASAKRSATESVQQEYQELSSIPYLSDLIDALPYVATILNSDRQIVYSNSGLLEKMGISDIGELLGIRFGEALRCIHSDKMDAGCGTSKFCQVCGAVNTIQKCMETGKLATDECRIRTFYDDQEEWLDLEVTASPFLHDKQQYTIFTARDISSEKRREALERIFFHDVINTAGTLQGVVDILKSQNDPKKVSEFIGLLVDVSRDLTEEILNQKSLLAAENGELAVKKFAFYLHETLEQIVKEYRGHELALNRKIKFVEDLCDVTLYTDPVLLRRVVVNMIKNALEAIREEEEITVSCQIKTESVIISVRNAGLIPAAVQDQIFQRSFTTKGKGRGLGTYSMKLLSERYLDGKVSFTSTQKAGTQFNLRLPISGEKMPD